MKVLVDNLYKSFGSTCALDGVSFELQDTNIFGFVGPNGAGKTTTMRIMATLDEPDSGDVIVDGTPLSHYPERIRHLVGYVPDSLPAHGDISVHEFLDFFARAYGLRGAQRLQKVRTIEAFTNLTGIKDKYLKALSKGMKQRVSLARALLHEPRILLMDEPAAGLDPRARIELRELLKVLASQGTAILISSHILSELTEICNGVIIVEQGLVLETGTIEEVLAKHKRSYEVVVRVQNQVEKLHRQLLEYPRVVDARLVDKEIFVNLQGGEDDSAHLLKNLIETGHQVVEFRHSKHDLEDIFLKVTEGKVQ